MSKLEKLKIVFWILLCIQNSYGTPVLYVPQNPMPKVNFDPPLNIGTNLTICLRIDLKAELNERILFGSQDNEILLVLRFETQMGIFRLPNWPDFVFPIPKDQIIPHSWHHICIGKSPETLMFVVEGKVWVEKNLDKTGKDTKSSFIDFLNIGSADKERPEPDFDGGISEINIWSQNLQLEQLVRITSECQDVSPNPDILDWKKLDKESIEGTFEQKDIDHLCYDSIENDAVVFPMELKMEQALHFCQVLNASLEFWPITLSESNPACAATIWTPYKRDSNGKWINGNNLQEENLNGQWAENQPDGEVGFQDCAYENLEDGLLYDDQCFEKLCFPCIWDYDPLFYIKGLCDSSEINTNLILVAGELKNGHVMFQGFDEHHIIFNGTDWVIVKDISNKTAEVFGIYTPAKQDVNLPVGTNFWTFFEEGCEGTIPIKLTHVSCLHKGH